MDKEIMLKKLKQCQKDRLKIYRLSNELYSNLKELEVMMYE